MLNRLFKVTLTLSLILVYIVIIAGAVVRMTGSGMGCPDWPKCFGYTIPPTNASQLDWKPNHNYYKGEKIIKNETLYVVKENFVSEHKYKSSNWQKYTKHDYATFNPVHTWIEYINRLATVVFGIPLLFLLVLSIFKWKYDKRFTLLSIALLVSVAIEAILGKIVVDTNLQPVKITLHVLFVFFIVAFLLVILFLFRKPQPLKVFNKSLNQLGVTVVILTLIQVTLGTQLRQFVDVQMQLNAHTNAENWLASPPLIFYIHRSFSIIVLIVNAIWIWKLKQTANKLYLVNWVGLLLILEIISGIVLYYVHFPFLSQPLHLLISSLLFSVQFYLVLRLYKTKLEGKNTITIA